MADDTWDTFGGPTLDEEFPIPGGLSIYDDSPEGDAWWAGVKAGRAEERAARQELAAKWRRESDEMDRETDRTPRLMFLDRERHRCYAVTFKCLADELEALNAPDA